MCGIIGYYNYFGCSVNELQAPLELLKSRGPDYQSSLKVNDNLIFGHTRLSIIDLSDASNQPFIKDDFYLTFNGEIFNYLEIKNELELNGYVFKTSSDTEVLLNSYIEWGVECVKKFNGMWAFSIYDRKKNILFCSRDRYGIKPFYYHLDDKSFIFSSNIKSILSIKKGIEPNLESINDFLYKGRLADSEQTWFKGISRLLPGHNLIYDFNKISINKYYSLKFKFNSNLNFKEALKKLDDLLEDSIKLRMRSDVEISSTLTSGIDSSTIVSYMKKGKVKFNTYTVYSEKSSFSDLDKTFFQDKDINLDESNFINLFKDNNTNPVKIKLSNSNYLKDLKNCIYSIESGHASPAIVGIFNLYKKVHKDKIKVLMEGQGADEILGGYVTDLFFIVIWDLIKNLKFNKLIKYIKSIKRYYSLKAVILSQFNLLLKSNFFYYLKIYISKSNVSKKIIFNKIDHHQNVSHKHQTQVLSNLLLYGDSLSMSKSVETRFPFLDYRLVDFCNSLPLSYKIKNHKGKYILREVANKYLPKDIYDSNIKIGFATPIDNIMNSDKEIKKLLLCPSNYFFDDIKVNKLLNRYFIGTYKNYNFIYKILTIKIWLSIYYNQKNKVFEKCYSNY